MIPRRIHSLDLLRGGGILVILVIHRLHYEWTGLSSREAVRAQLDGPLKPFIIATIALFTMAGVFYFVTGFVNAYSLNNRIRNGTPARLAIRGGIVAGVWLIALNYVHRILLVNGFPGAPGQEAPRFPAGLLTGRLRYGAPVPFRWSLITEPGTLALIGWILIIVTLLLGWLLSRHAARGAGRLGRVSSVLLTLAGVVLAAAPLLRWGLRPAYESALASGHILRATLFGLLSDEFGLFPYLAFGLVGAVFGTALAEGREPRAVRKRACLGSLVLFVVAVVAIVASDRQDDFGRRVAGVAVSAAELSLFILLWVVLSKLFDEPGRSERRRQRWFIRGITRFGAVALSVYALEPLLAEALRRPLNAALRRPWADSFFWVLAFGLLCAAVWWTLLVLWEKRRFFASLEWVSVRLLRTLGKKESGKLKGTEADC
jgi:surface polysaccharide O-acyltransferase-like enzyme